MKPPRVTASAGSVRRNTTPAAMPQRHREQRVADRDDALDVEPVRQEPVQLQRVVRAGPPGDQGRDGTGADSRRQAGSSRS